MRKIVAIDVESLWAFFEFLCMWIAIPQFENSGYISVPAGLFAALWPVVAYDGQNGSSWLVERLCTKDETDNRDQKDLVVQRTTLLQWSNTAIQCCS